MGKQVPLMNVAVHNPSNIELKTAEILVPKGTYEVTSFTGQKLNNNLKCIYDYIDHIDQTIKVESCTL